MPTTKSKSGKLSGSGRKSSSSSGNARHHNCYLAIDGRTGDILASVEYQASADYQELTLLGINKTFTARKRMRVTAGSGLAKLENREPRSDDASLLFERTPREQIHDWLLARWSQWVPVAWKPYHHVAIGGGSYWPLKVLRKREWNDDSKGHYSFEHGGRKRP